MLTGLVLGLGYQLANSNPYAVGNIKQDRFVHTTILAGLTGIAGTVAGAAYGAIRHYQGKDEPTNLRELSHLPKEAESSEQLGKHTQALLTERKNQFSQSR